MYKRLQILLTEELSGASRAYRKHYRSFVNWYAKNPGKNYGTDEYTDRNKKVFKSFVAVPRSNKRVIARANSKHVKDFEARHLLRLNKAANKYKKD